MRVPMQIKLLLLTALRDRDPRQLTELSRDGELDDWANVSLQTANEIYSQLTKGAERFPNGLVKDPALRLSAEEQALAAVTDDLLSREPSDEGAGA
jgi:hypothetical protein